MSGCEETLLGPLCQRINLGDQTKSKRATSLGTAVGSRVEWSDRICILVPVLVTLTSLGLLLVGLSHLML